MKAAIYAEGLASRQLCGVCSARYERTPEIMRRTVDKVSGGAVDRESPV